MMLVYIHLTYINRHIIEVYKIIGGIEIEL